MFKFSRFHISRFIFRGSYFRVLVVGHENHENLDLAKISRYRVVDICWEHTAVKSEFSQLLGMESGQVFFDVDYIVSPFPEHDLILKAWYGVSEALLQLLLSESYLIESRRPLRFGLITLPCTEQSQSHAAHSY